MAGLKFESCWNRRSDYYVLLLPISQEILGKTDFKKLLVHLWLVQGSFCIYCGEKLGVSYFGGGLCKGPLFTPRLTMVSFIWIWDALRESAIRLGWFGVL